MGRRLGLMVCCWAGACQTAVPATPHSAGLLHGDVAGTQVKFLRTLAVSPVQSPALTWGAPAAAALDFDRDGDLDLVVPSGFAFWKAKAAGISLLRNDGAGSFLDLGAASGLTTPRIYSNIYAFDYDNDGDLDVYATANESSQYYNGAMDVTPSADGFDVLYRNQGDGTFVDVTAAAGVHESGNSWGAAIGDVDGDGWLDIYVAQYVDADLLGDESAFAQTGPVEKDLLYHNRGDGTFAEEAAQHGLGTAMPSDRLGYTPLLVDYDRDGDADILLPQDFGRIVLYINDGKGNYSDGSARLQGVGIGTWMGCAGLDLDQDGNLDFVCDNGGTSALTNKLIRSSWPDQPSSTPYMALLRNDGDGHLVDMAAQVTAHGVPEFAGLAPLPAVGPPVGLQKMPWGWGLSTGDIDNDGREDLLQTGSFAVFSALVVGTAEQGATAGVLLRRTGPAEFADVTASAGMLNIDPEHGMLAGWGNLLVDLTGDGSLDAVVCNYTTSWLQGGIRLYQNAGSPYHWLAVEPRGTQSNRDGVGTEVRLFGTPGTPPQLRVRLIGGWGGGPTPLHFGLGVTATVERLEIRWPSGKLQTVVHPLVDRVLHVVEP